MAKRLRCATLFVLALLPTGTHTPVAAAGEAPTGARTEARLLIDTAYYPALLGKIRRAQKSIDLAMYLWKTTAASENKPGELVRALGEARRRGVLVRVLLETSAYDEALNLANHETAAQLAHEGITAYFDSPTVTTHAKLAVIDQRFCLVGSHNLTQSALGRNHEISVLLDNPGLAGELSRYMDSLAGTP